jgi:hypothetical protein
MMDDRTGTALSGAPVTNGAASLSDADLMALVERYLEPHQPADYRLDVARREGVRRSGNWHYLVVRPSQSDVRLHDYSTRLGAAEDDIEANEDLKVLLVPILPE